MFEDRSVETKKNLIRLLFERELGLASFVVNLETKWVSTTKSRFRLGDARWPAGYAEPGELVAES